MAAPVHAGERKGCVVRSTTYDPAGTVSEGIVAYERAVPDGGSLDSVGRYRRLAAEVRSAMRPGDTCALAFAAGLDRPDGARRPAPAFIAVLDDRLVVAWRTGRLRSGSEVVSVPSGSITAVRVRAARAGDPKHVRLTIAADPEIVLTALPGTQAALRDVLDATAAPTPQRVAR